MTDRGNSFFPDPPDFFEEEEFDETRERLMKICEEINDLAECNDISIRKFNDLSYYYLRSENDAELTAFEAASEIFYNLITTTDLPRYVKNKKHLQKMIVGNYYLKKGDKGFTELADQTNVRYGGIIYVIKPAVYFCVFPNIVKLIYIGVTWKTLLERFTEHVGDAVGSYMKDCDWSSRLIERLIQTAMQDLLKHKYQCISGISPLQDFIASEIEGKEEWKKKNVIKIIAEELCSTYFEMEVIEVHKNYETALPRESWYIENFTHFVNGKPLEGTLKPNGLNMITPPKTTRHKTLPLYDIIFLVSLGGIGPKINEMLQQYYKINISYNNIYRILSKFWGSWDNILELFFKPVLQVLLEHSDYDWGAIAKVIHRNPSYRNKKRFNKWFYELNVTQLRYVMKREDFDWDNLRVMAREFKAELGDKSIIKGFPVEVWTEWFIVNIGMDVIADKLGYRNVQSFRSAWTKQGRVSIFQLKFGASYTLTVKECRKKRAIELLTNRDFVETLEGSRLYWLYVNEFRFMRYQDYAVDRPSQGLRNCYDFFDNLFKDEGIKAEELENINAFTYTNNSRISSIVKRILNF